MKPWMLALVLMLLAGCGAETATTAATGASIKQREIEEGKKVMERSKASVEEAMEQSRQRAAADADK